MLNRDPKTMADVTDIVLVAVKSKVKVKFYEGPVSGKMSYSSAAELYSVMTPTEMWHEVYRKLKAVDIEIYREEFDALKNLYNSIIKQDESNSSN